MPVVIESEISYLLITYHLQKLSIKNVFILLELNKSSVIYCLRWEDIT